MQKPYPLLIIPIAVALAIGIMIWAMGETHGPSGEASYQSQTTGAAPAKKSGIPAPPEDQSDKRR